MEINIDWVEQLARTEEKLENADHVEFNAYLDDRKLLRKRPVHF